MEITQSNAMISLYRARSKSYDFSARLFPLVGFRQNAYRKLAVHALHLQPGDTVVDIGCGTGLSFPLMEQAIGPTGKIIGVDLTDTMLDCARKRIVSEGWTNVELVQSDAASFAFPANVSAIISAFALTLVPEFDIVVCKGSEALIPGGRWVVLDFKLPETRLARLAPLLALLLIRPFGGTLAMSRRHPWESLRKYLDHVVVKNVFGGFAYVASGERKMPTVLG
jgi:demethylmenaquinone methyltransferase/2-methoxy-6-polyprenyl-1,4-benzoquinol methylase